MIRHLIKNLNSLVGTALLIATQIAFAPSTKVAKGGSSSPTKTKEQRRKVLCDSVHTFTVTAGIGAEALKQAFILISKTHPEIRKLIFKLLGVDKTLQQMQELSAELGKRDSKEKPTPEEEKKLMQVRSMIEQAQRALQYGDQIVAAACQRLLEELVAAAPDVEVVLVVHGPETEMHFSKKGGQKTKRAMDAIISRLLVLITKVYNEMTKQQTEVGKVAQAA